MLPLKLGEVYIATSQWKLTTVYDLSTVIEAAQHARQETKHLLSEIRNQSEFHNYVSLLEYGSDKMFSQLKQILPSTSLSNRTKRGALNFLGGVIKAITGNLDNEDADL